MSILGAVKSALSGGDIVGAVERVSLEFFQTNLENAQAQAVAIKALDPNGKMRRDIMKFIRKAYGFYLINATILIYAGVYGIDDPERAKMALDTITATFLPITGLFGTLATASFGVNAANTLKEK